ncbi:MAG: DUF350 domain-containing protein [Roseburia sp.]|nr:DUF350 domain-containing protein [Roseburia sp.]MCM1277817.1 DUF350 domain-containing protein [Robinsoniella sp.]
MWIELLETIIYGVFGMVMLFLGKFIIDLFVPYDFPKEIKEKNTAAGYMIAGIFISIALIIRTVII